MAGISTRVVDQLPIAVVDLETTGLHSAGDRIIELAIVRMEPQQGPKVVLDTLVNPGRRVSATEIHGITDAEVRDAPRFEELVPLVMESLGGAVFASYNVYFDAKFISAELYRSGIESFPPHLCLMYMRPLLDLGGRCSLADACREHGVQHGGVHVAAEDAVASAALWSVYLSEMRALEIRTFHDIARRRRYKFTKSFHDPLIDLTLQSRSSVRLKSRRDAADVVVDEAVTLTAQQKRGEYWDAIKAALADLEVTAAEIDYLSKKRKDLALSDSEVRSIHARAFAGLLADLTDDHVVDDHEVRRICAMAEALRKLGWSPGDPVGGGDRMSSRAGAGWLSRIFGQWGRG